MQTFWNREWQQLRKRGMVLLLLISCLALVLVMADQARTVEQQRLLIQVLQGDSQQLFAGRVRDLLKGHSPQKDQAAPSPQTTPAPPKSAAPPATRPHSFRPVVEPTRMLHSI